MNGVVSGVVIDGVSTRNRALFSLLITTLTRTNAAATLSDLEYGAYPGWKSQSDSQSLCPSPVIMISPLKTEINLIRHAQVLFVRIINTLKKILLKKSLGGSVAERLERWTCNSEAPSSSPTLGPVARSMVSVNQRLTP